MKEIRDQQMGAEEYHIIVIDGFSLDHST